MHCFDNDSIHGIFHQIGKLHYLRYRKLLEGVHVYPGQPPVLFALYKNDGQSQKELAQSIGVKAATMTVMIQRMEKNDLIQRKKDENDQRKSRIFITEKGKQLVEELRNITKKVQEECLLNFTDEEKILLRRLLLQVRDNLMDDEIFNDK